MTLQDIHTGMGVARASSLYNRWIQVPVEAGVRLQAICIDHEMRDFEGQFAESLGLEQLEENALDEPGGAAWSRFALAIH